MRSIVTRFPGLFALILLSGWGAHAGPGNPLRQIPLVELEVRTLPGSPDEKPQQLVLKSDRPGRLEFDVEWDGVGRVRVELTARAEPAGDAGAQSLSLQALLILPGGRKIQASRQSVVDQRGTVLFELFRQDERPFTLAIEATVSETWEVVRAPAVGAPVRFDIEIIRAVGHARESFERNILNTFENQTVRYEFHAGPDLEDEALTLSLTPVRLIGDIAEIRVVVIGRLPHGDDVTLIARDEIQVANRGSSFAITVMVGDPPAGYVFQVTPRF
jgi:hypothetical protein